MPQEPRSSSSPGAAPRPGADVVLRRLRVAATLTHGLPGARLLLDDGDRVRAVARTHPADLAPCALRRAIGVARETDDPTVVHELLALDGPGPLHTRLVLTDDAVTDLQCGLYGIRAGAHLGLVFATLLTPEGARAVARAELESTATPCAHGEHRPLRIHTDTATDVTVFTGQVPVDGPDAHRFVERTLAVAGACVVEEVLVGA
jgi:hypothetical protein